MTVLGPAGLPLLSQLDPVEQQLGSDPTLLHDELRAIIEHAMRNHPRTLQTAIGPSEVGTPCVRLLAYKLGQVPMPHAERLAWRATVGTAVHAWLAERFTLANEGLPRARWLVEMRVSPGEIAGVALYGSSDIYDRVTASVVDWKVVSQTTLREVRRDGPRVGYRRQVHLYGRGFRRRGLLVERVHIAYLPAAGELGEAVWWSEPYDEQLAVEALDRATAVTAAGNAIGFGAVAAAAATDDDHCRWCPWLVTRQPDPAAGRCPGSASYQAERRVRSAPPSGDPLA